MELGSSVYIHDLGMLNTAFFKASRIVVFLHQLFSLGSPTVLGVVSAMPPGNGP
jgi:hypothetical protein